MSGRIRVVGAVILGEGGVLLARRPPGGRHGGLWEFPGGKVEEGESDAQALIRELAEELGVGAEVGAWVAMGQDERVELHCYLTALHGEARALEHERLAWFGLAEASQVPTPPADRPGIRALADLIAPLSRF